VKCIEQLATFELFFNKIETDLSFTRKLDERVAGLREFHKEDCRVILGTSISIFSILAMAMGKKTKFESAVVDKVRAMRMKKNFSQDDIAAVIDTSRGFIGQVESPKSASKYNLNHLNKLADAMGCSPRDFIPEKYIDEKGKGR
jgi:DNA-binding XRE family transcriptional regulator